MYRLSVRCNARPSQELWDRIVALLYTEHCIGVDEGEEPPPDGTDSLLAADEFQHALQPGLLDPPMEFKGWFRDLSQAEHAARVIAPHLAALSPHIDVTHEEEKNWAEAWKSNFSPILAEPFFRIRAPWHEKAASSETLELVIEPGMAFGTGSHETTRACLELTAEALGIAKKTQIKPLDLDVLDFGCGSGILAIAVKLLGVKRAYGIDIDPLSIEASARNAEMNGVTFACSTELKELGLPEKLDGIVANILKNTLLDFASLFASRLKKNGFLILSGLLAEQETEILAAYLPLGFKLERRIVRADTSPKDLVAADNGQFRWEAMLLRRI